MTIDITAETLVEDPRYALCKVGDMGVKVRRAPQLPPVRDDTKLLDISQYGAKLLVSSRLPVHESIVLVIEVPELQQDFSFPAIVRWVQPSDDATWRLGCLFPGALPEDILTELAVLGYLERRQERRQTVDVDARARWELAEDDFPVRVISVSAGGVCVSCSEAGKVGDRLLLQLDGGEAEPVFIPARAVWQRATGGRCLIGCALASSVDYELLCSILQLSGAGGRARADSRRWGPLLGWAVLIAVVAICLAAYFL